METVNDMEVRLWEYIDGLSTTDETSVVETLIRDNKEWRDRYHELLQVNSSLAGLELEQPSLRFTKNVMEEIVRHQIAPATKNYINTKIIWGIATFFILSIAGLLVFGIGQINWSASSEASNPLGIEIQKVNYEAFFSSTVMNVFMMLNAVLGLMLLDRYIAGKRKKLYDAA